MKFWISLLSFATILPAVASESEGVCTSTFEAHASFGHDFSGASTSKTFTVRFEDVADDPKISFLAETSFDEVTTFHKKRDKEMREHFHAETFPTISGAVQGFSMKTLSGAQGSETVEMPFSMVFMGVTNVVNAHVSNFQHPDGGITSFDATFTFSHKDFQVKPKSMIGLFKVKNDVFVKSHVEIQPAKP